MADVRRFAAIPFVLPFFGNLHGTVGSGVGGLEGLEGLSALILYLRFEGPLFNEVYLFKYLQEIVTQVGQVTAQQNQIIESTSEATRQSLDFVQTQQKKLAEAVQASISELQREIIGIQATVAAMERFRRIPDFPSTFVPSIQLSSSGNVPSAADAFSAASVLSSTPSVPYQPWTLGGEYKNPSTFSTFPSSGSIRTGGVSRLASPTIPS